jgi:integrase
VSGVQVPFLASLKTSLCAGFPSFYTELQLCPTGVKVENIHVSCGRFGVKAEVNLRNNLSTYAPMTKASAGTVTVKNSNGRLQLVIPYKGGRKYLSLKLPDSKQNRDYAEMQAKRIQLDLLAHNFDESLEKYSRESLIDSPATIDDASIKTLWARYTDYKRSQLSQTTIAKDFERIAQHIDRFPCEYLADAVKIRDHLIKSNTPNTTKRVLTQLGAAANWAVKSGIIAVNPFLGMAADIRTSKKNDNGEIHPFSPAERDLIIQRFRDDGSHYAALVEFLFRTGCRPSEAIALQWRSITPGYRSIIFDQAVTIGEEGLRVKQGLKTQERREFPCGEKLKTFVQSIEPSPKDPEQFIFQSPKGKLIDFQNFASREWKPTIKKLGIDKRNSNPYQMRHTFITCALDSGMDAKDVAKLVGNSPEMIYRHYAGAKRDLIAPDF